LRNLLHWVLADAQRRADFNSKIIAKIGRRRGTGLVIRKREDFEDLKESEVLDICSNDGLLQATFEKSYLRLPQDMCMEPARTGSGRNCGITHRARRVPSNSRSI